VLDSITMQPLSGFAFNSRPQSLTGKWQHMIFGTTQGGIYVLLTKWNTIFNKRDTIASAKEILTGMAMLWEDFSINLNYQSGGYPDSCIIFLKASGSSPAEGDYLWLDDLAFAGEVAGIENETSILKNILLYPNPTNNSVILELYINSVQKATIELIALNGSVVISENIGKIEGFIKHTLNVSKLVKGFYFIRVITESSTEVRKIIIQ
jgi:hypothetical protein